MEHCKDEQGHKSDVRHTEALRSYVRDKRGWPCPLCPGRKVRGDGHVCYALVER